MKNGIGRDQREKVLIERDFNLKGMNIHPLLIS